MAVSWLKEECHLKFYGNLEKKGKDYFASRCFDIPNAHFLMLFDKTTL